MTEADYFDALRGLLDTSIRQLPNAKGGHYTLQEPNQKPFELHAKGLASHASIRLEKLPGGDWPCFKSPHKHAHLRCDSIIVGWDRKAMVPQYLLVELKSTNTGKAHKQLGASLAFCHFAHRMVCVGHSSAPVARFASITVRELPFASKATSLPTLPPWNPEPLQVDCRHMHYDRRRGSLPLAVIMANY
jgi:hypothetical protein